MFRFAIVMLAAVFLSACAGDVLRVSMVKQESFQENAILVGSVVSPDDGIIDVFYIVNIDTKERFRVIDQEPIPEDSEHYQLGMFAVVVPPGRYAYFSVNYSGGAEKGGVSMTWARPRAIVNRKVEAGEFVYIGRAFCDATVNGCNWSLEDESVRDLPLLKKLNPRLPWDEIKFQQENR